MKRFSLHLKRTRIVLLLALLSVAGVTNAFAQTAYTDEDSGLRYTLNGDEATVVGCVSGTTDISIPDELSIWNEVNEDYDYYTVVAVANNAFQNNTEITSLSIGDYVTEIGENAFRGCTELYSVSFGSSITTIGAHAFDGCTEMSGDFSSLVDIETIGEYAFNGCTSMSGDLDFSEFNNLSAIESHAFAGTGITSITLYDNISDLGDAAFQNCASLSAITLNSDVTFGANVFSGCGDPDSGLTLTIGEDVTGVSNTAFVGLNNISTLYYNATDCSSFSTGTTSFFDAADELFTTLELGYDVANIPAFAFKGCAGLSNISLPASLNVLGESAFAGCTGLTDIDFSNCESLTEIPANAFSGCVNVQNINTGSYVTTIGANAFNGCGTSEDVYSLSITIGEYVEQIDGTAFAGCQNLTDLTFNATNLETMNNQGASLFAGTVGHEDGFTLTIGDEVTIIPDYAFKGCKINAMPSFPYELRTLGVSAFENCTMMDGDLDLSSCEMLETISESAFKGCYVRTNDGTTGISSIITGDYMTTIGANAFSGCKLVTEINIGEAVETIGANAFNGCGSDADVSDLAITIGPAVTAIDGTAFTGCQHLTSLTFNAIELETMCTSTNTSLFAGTVGHEDGFTLTIGDEVSIIPDYAFKSCKINEMPTFPESLMSIGVSAFESCTMMSGDLDLSYCEMLETISESAFKGCYNATNSTGITSINTGDYVTSIGANAFNGCALVTEITIGEAVETIGANAFANCGSNAEVSELRITIGPAVTAIDGTAFTGCKNLTDLTFNAIELETMNNNGASLFAGTVGADDGFTLTIGEEVTLIPDYAFKSCKVNAVPTFPESLTYIGVSAFESCNMMDGDLDLSSCESLETISESAFKNCANTNEGTGLTSINTGDDVTTIGANAFYGCALVTEITIGLNVSSVANNSFTGCNGLETLNFNAATLESFSTGSTSFFDGADANFTTLNIGDEVTIIPPYAFKGCKGISQVPDFTYLYVETIGVSAFEGCEEMSGSLDFSDSPLTEIAASAFKTCKALESINTGDEVTTIGASAFNGCSSVTEITLGKAVETIGSAAFTGCNALETLNYNAINLTSGISTGTGTSITSIFKKTNSAFQNFNTLNIGDEVEVIPAGAFRACTELTGDLTLPETLTTIGEYAFAGDTQLEGSIEIPESLETIGAYAFQNCYKLEGDLDFSDCAVTEIPTFAFSGTAITSVIIGDNITSIGASAFAAVTATNEALTSVNIGKNVTSIGNKAFGTNKALAEIIFNASGTCTVANSNSNYIFNSCTNNDVNLEVTIGEDVTTVPAAIFTSLNHITKVIFNARACTSMQNTAGSASLFPKPALVEEIEIGDEVTIIPAYAFSGFTIMDGYIDLSNVTTIGAYAFNNCKALSSDIDLSSVTSLGANAFSTCNAVTGITIGDQLQEIPANAFKDCKNASTLVIGSSVTNIGSTAFSNLNSENSYAVDITSRAATAPTLASGFANNVYINGSLTVPCGSYSSYQNANNWKTFHTKETLYTSNLYNLIVSSENEAMGTAAITQDPCDNGEHGDGIAIVTATPTTGFAFVNWTDEEGQEVSTDNPYSFQLTSDLQLVAHFEYSLVADCIFEGTEDEMWNNANNWSNQTLPTAENSVLVSANVNVSTTDAVAASVAIAEGKVMTVNGKLTVSGDINSLAATAVVINDGGQVNSANDFLGTAKKTITAYDPEAEKADGWYLIASPLAEEGTINGLFSNDYDLYLFDQNGDADGYEWFNYEDQTNGGFAIATKGQTGYLYANNTNTELEFVGTLNGAAAPELSLVKSDNADITFAGWNLVGNPFTCDAFISGDYYRMNTERNELTIASGAVAPLEGIFVEAETDGQTLQFSKQQMQSTGNQSNLTMTVSRNRGTVDMARVRFGNGRNMSKFMLNESHSKLYIPENDKRMAVVSVSETEGEMPVNFEATENGTYSIAFTTEDAEVSYLHLIDNMTGMDVDLLQTPSYTFEAKTSDYASRFKLVFNASSVGNDDSFAYFNGSNFVIANDGKATLQVVDVMGRLLSSETISGNAEVSINQPAGVYMLRLINGNDVKVQKVVVR